MKKIALLALLMLILAMLGGCGNVKTGDQTADRGLEAFNALVAQNKDRKGFHAAMMHWGLSLPGGDKFEWTKDTSANGLDFAMALAAEAFLDAGLDADRLSSGDFLYKEAGVEDGMQTPELLIHAFNVSDKKETAQGSEDALRRILKQSPELMSYDGSAELYTLALAEGFEVRWTETPGKAGVDMMFVIAADPLVAAGVDVAMLEDSGWIYSEAAGGAAESSPNQLIRTYSLTDGK